MAAGSDGVWTAELEDAADGDPYYFRITTPEGTLDRLDPRALGRDPSGTRSLIAGQGYTWGAAEGDFARPGLHDAVIYEMHAGTFHDEPGGAPGSLVDASARLDHLAEIGINVVELLPVTDFPGEYSWGYNPQLPYVVDEVYGGPDALQAFVQAAHERGIAVVLDIVYNHLTDDNPLCAFDGGDEAGCGGIYFYEDEYPDTPWGPRFDYDRGQVRDYLQDNAWMWVETFHVDGFRWDSTGNIRATDHGNGEAIPAGEAFLRDANEALHAGAPGFWSIAEDLSGEPLLTKPREEGGYGFDAQWDGGFHAGVVGALKAAGSGDPDMGAVRSALRDGAGFDRVVFTESHDTTGKLNGHVRLPQAIDPSDPEGDRAQRLSAVALALTLTAPGVPMLLQGQEWLEAGTFHDDAPLDWKRRSSHAGFVALTTDLIGLRRNLGGVSAGLRGARIDVHHLHETSNVVAYHRYDDGGVGDDVVVVANLSAVSFSTYRVGVPASGTWEVRVDTSKSEYELGYGVTQAGPTSYEATPEAYDGLPANALVSLVPYGVLVLSQQ